MRKCFEPGELMGRSEVSLFGGIAEKIIQADYLRNVKRVGAFPASQKEFFDIHRGFSNTNLYKGFLKGCHPRLSTSELLTLAAKQTNVPDIMTHDPPRRTEFYEVKPSSPTGLSDGIDKIATIDALIHYYNLPYVPGRQYSPDKRIEFFSGQALGFNVRLLLEFKRVLPGLIVYRICVDGNAGDMLMLAGLAAVVLIAMIGASRGRLPVGPAPVY